MMKVLTERGYSFIPTAERGIVWDVQGKLCYAVLDLDTETKAASNTAAAESAEDLAVLVDELKNVKAAMAKAASKAENDASILEATK